MLRRLAVALSLLLATSLAPRSAEACTTFCKVRGGEVVVGKSYDWHLGQGLVLHNKRNVAKQALVTQGTAARWTSKYASLTFNQYGREFPNGGMNEKGLVIEIMWLDTSRYPAPDDRPAISELQWIQYHLDRFATLDEVRKSADGLVVTPFGGKVHYLVCDETGACGAFEYVDGKLVVSAGPEFEHRALTNSTYAESLAHLRGQIRRDGWRLPKGKSSLDRFVLAAHGAALGESKDPILGAFEVLDRVRNGDYTKWQIVYEPRARRIHFRSLGHESIKVVDLDDFQPSCKTPVRMLDLQTDARGDVGAAFVEFDEAANAKLLEQTLGGTEGVAASVLVPIVSRYPRATSCRE